MPRFLKILENMKDYPFAKINRISNEVEVRDGIHVINARIGIPDREVAGSVKQQMANFILREKSTYGYPSDVHPQRGIPELVETIIEDYLQKYGVKLNPENIAVTGWTKEVLHNLVRMTDSGKVLVPDPVYPAYEGAALLSLRDIERVKCSPGSKWLPEFKLGETTASALYFCDPNNPTGAVATIGFYERLRKEMMRHEVFGIFDKAYKDFVYDSDVKPVSITQIPGMMDYGFEVVSLSKHYNFVGIGLGWMISNKDNIDHWLKFSSNYSEGVEWYKQKTGVEVLTSNAVKADMAEYFGILKERRDILTNGLNELGLETKKPQATPYLWVKVPQGFDDEHFVLEKMIGEAHVAFMPGSYFGQNGKGFFRTTLYISKPDIENALDRISKIRTW